MKDRDRMLRIVPLMVFTLSLFAPAASPTELTAKKVTIAYTSYTASHLLFLLEKELGYFRHEGLVPEAILLRSAALGLRGLLAGNFDYMIPTGPAIESVIRARQPVKVVFTGRLANFWLVAKPDIPSIADLKGKTVGVMAPGTASDFIMREILKRHGLDPYKDMTLLSGGLTSERFAALASGAVDSALLTPPFNFKAVEMGFRKLAIAREYLQWPLTGLVTRDEKIRLDEAEVGKMVRVLAKGQRLMLTEKDYVIAKLTQIFQLSRDDSIKTYAALTEDLIPSGYLTDDAQRTVISLSKQAANITEDIPLDRVFDYRFAKQAEQEIKGWKPQGPK